MNSGDYPVEIRYTRRRGSIGFRVSHQGVRVLAPHRTPAKVIERVLEQRRPWIEEQLALLRARQPAHTSRLVQGSELHYLGTPYPLSVVAADDTVVVLDSGQLCVDLPGGEQSPRLAATLEHWYQREAEGYLPDKLRLLGERLEQPYASLKIRHYKSRWGSCDQRRRITLNNRLMMLPEVVIDYVLIHELCHLVHLNHSPAFWSEVERHCPDYRQHRRWLRTQGAMLADLPQP